MFPLYFFPSCHCRDLIDNFGGVSVPWIDWVFRRRLNTSTARACPNWLTISTARACPIRFTTRYDSRRYNNDDTITTIRRQRYASNSGLRMASFYERIDLEGNGLWANLSNEWIWVNLLTRTSVYEVIDWRGQTVYEYIEFTRASVYEWIVLRVTRIYEGISFGINRFQRIRFTVASVYEWFEFARALVYE